MRDQQDSALSPSSGRYHESPLLNRIRHENVYSVIDEEEIEEVGFDARHSLSPTTDDKKAETGGFADQLHLLETLTKKPSASFTPRRPDTILRNFDPLTNEGEFD